MTKLKKILHKIEHPYQFKGSQKEKELTQAYMKAYDEGNQEKIEAIQKEQTKGYRRERIADEVMDFVIPGSIFILFIVTLPFSFGFIAWFVALLSDLVSGLPHIVWVINWFVIMGVILWGLLIHPFIEVVINGKPDR